MNTTVQVNDVEVITHGEVSANLQEYARTKIMAAVEHSPAAVLHVRIRLSSTADPAVPRPYRAEARVDVNGRLIRAQTSAATGRTAVDQLAGRLRYRLGRLARHWEARRGSRPTGEPHAWRRGSEPSRRPAYFPRPAGQREVVSHKSFTPRDATPDEAALDMDLLDYDFYLFTEADTGQDSILYRGGPTGYRLALVQPDTRHQWKTAVPLTVSPASAPRLSTAEAVERLDLTELPFVFYADTDTGRGRVLYRRYDGHYGLITPSS